MPRGGDAEGDKKKKKKEKRQQQQQSSRGQPAKSGGGEVDSSGATSRAGGRGLHKTQSYSLLFAYCKCNGSLVYDNFSRAAAAGFFPPPPAVVGSLSRTSAGRPMHHRHVEHVQTLLDFCCCCCLLFFFFLVQTLFSICKPYVLIMSQRTRPLSLLRPGVVAAPLAPQAALHIPRRPGTHHQ